MALRLLRRGAIAWCLVRLILVFFGFLSAPDGRSPLALTPSAQVVLAMVVVAIALIDTRRRHEHVFLANLGVSPAMTTGYLLVPTVLGELVLGALVA